VTAVLADGVRPHELLEQDLTRRNQLKRLAHGALSSITSAMALHDLDVRGIQMTRSTRSR